MIWRKLSFGTRSAAGSRFVETLLTVIETCRQQRRDLFAFVTPAVEHHLSHQPAPLTDVRGVNDYGAPHVPLMTKPGRSRLNDGASRIPRDNPLPIGTSAKRPTMQDETHRRRTFTTAALAAVVVVLLYVGSFGPVHWIIVDPTAPVWIRPVGWCSYWPLFWLLRAGPQRPRMLLWRYVELCQP